MDLVFASECRLEKCLDGKIYSTDGSFSSKLWDRYLTVFEKVYIIARVLYTQKESLSPELLSESDRVTIIEIPHYIGPLQYLRKRQKIIKIIKKESIPGRAYICRIPGQIGFLLIKFLHKKKIPYAVEVVGDPWDVFAPGIIRNPFRPIFRLFFKFALKKAVRDSSAASYVTKCKLQKRYPVNRGIFQIICSNANIKEVKEAPKELKYAQVIKLISIGSLSQMYKSPDVVLKAIKILESRGLSINLVWIGSGYYKNSMIGLSKVFGIENRVAFIGEVPFGEQIMEQLTQADIFIMASRAEGLPCAMIEAMAMGLPCIGTRVGGIPELLDTRVLIKPNDSYELADKIEFMINNPEFTNAQAERNLKEASNYKDSVLQGKRETFYNEVKRITQETISDKK